MQRAGSAEKAVLSAQRAIDRMGITGSGQRYVIIKIYDMSIRARVFIKDGIARISTLEKM